MSDLGERIDPAKKKAMQYLLDQSRADKQSLAQLLELYRNYLWTIASEELATPLTAKISPLDVVQDVIVKAHEGFKSFHSHTIDELTAWLRTLLKHQLSDLRRRYTNTQMRQLNREISLQDLDSRNFLEQLATDEEQNPAELMSKLDDKLRIVAAIAALPPHYQQVVRWRLEGLDNEEIGNRLGINSNSARALWLRAITKLRELLSTEFENIDTP